MPIANVFNMAGEQVGTIELSEAVFGIEPNTALLHAAVKNYLLTRDRALRVLSPAQKFPAAASSPGDRRVPAALVQAPPAHPSSLTVVSCLHPSPVTTATA